MAANVGRLCAALLLKFKNDIQMNKKIKADSDSLAGGTKPIVSRRSKSKNEMKTIDEIRQALKDMETRRTSAMLDMVEKMPNGIKYDTDIIRRLESIDVTIHALKWVLQPTEANGGQRWALPQ